MTAATVRVFDCSNCAAARAFECAVCALVRCLLEAQVCRTWRVVLNHRLLVRFDGYNSPVTNPTNCDSWHTLMAHAYAVVCAWYLQRQRRASHNPLDADAGTRSVTFVSFVVFRRALACL